MDEIESAISVQAELIVKLRRDKAMLQQQLAETQKALEESMNKKPAKLDHDSARALCDAGYMTHEAYARFCKENPGGVSTNADSGGGGVRNPPPPGTDGGE